MNKIELRELALHIMSKYGLKEWKFVYIESKRCFGVCNYQKKEIGLSWLLCENRPVKRNIDTILHEIAHALTPGDRHGKKWKERFVLMGGSGEVCSNC